MQKQKSKTLFIAQAGIIAALYAVLCIVLAPISYSAIQVRVAEALCILPYFTPAAIPGLTVGCLVANIYGSGIFDIVFGTLATLIGAVGSYALRRYKYLVPVPPIVANTVIIPFVIKYATVDPVTGESIAIDDTIPFLMMTIAIGEIIAVGILGIALMLALEKSSKVIFAKPE
ncbi:MAG: QueT transporter family protein [Lachnospiraceae bacterium]|nr:QueT transporter family protein [Lachnospiraceae bacterium]